MAILQHLSCGVEGYQDLTSKYFYAIHLLNYNDSKQGLKILQLMAEEEYQPALCRIGAMYMQGTYGKEKNVVRAKELFEKGSLAGHVYSTLLLARIKLRNGSLLDRIKALPSAISAVKYAFYAAKKFPQTDLRRFY